MRFTAGHFKRRIQESLPEEAPDLSSAGPVALPGEPITVDLRDLLPIAGDDQFLHEAYRRILGREADISGFLNHRQMLRSHVPRRVILYNLATSDEAKLTGRVYQNLGGPRFLGGRLRYRFVERVRSAGRATVTRSVGFLRGLLFRRFDLLENKVDYLLEELESRSERVSAKVDHTLWTVSEKLDSYVADMRQRQETVAALVDEIHSTLNGAALERLDGMSAQFEQLASRMDAQSVEIRERQALLHHRQLVIDDHLTAVEHQLATRLKTPLVHGGENVTALELDGFILGVPGEEWRLTAYYTFRGFPEPGLVRLFKSIVKPGMVVVDVGAHIGLYTLQAARLVGAAGRVHCFEPTPRTFSILKDNVRVNAFAETGIVVLHQAAVSDRAGTADLHVFSAESGHNTLFGGQADTRVRVDTVALDEALRDEPRVDVVKIDAEGAEPLILRGMREIIARNPQLRIFIEFAPEHLRRAGFTPEAFLDEIAGFGLSAMVVDDMTGELSPVDTEKLPHAITANLCLQREPDAEVGA